MSTDKSILFVHFGDNGIRGSERVLIDLICNLPQRFKPHLWTNNPALANELTGHCVTITEDCFTQLLGWVAPRFDVRNYLTLRRKAKTLLKNNQIDLIHCNSAAPNQWLSPIARQLKTPLILHLHAHYLLRDLLGLRVFSVPCVVSASPTVTEELENWVGAQKLFRTITNSINRNLFTQAKPTDLKSELGLDSKDCLFICVGALVPAKGPMVLLKALKQLDQNGVRVNLAFAGEGLYRHELETFCSDNGLSDQVHFLGQRSDIPSVLSGDIDGFVTPTLFECYPLVLGEAGLAGLPTIASKTGGIPYIIEHEKSGLLVEPDDSNSLASAIERLVLNPKFRKRLGEKFQTDAQARFDMKRFVVQFVSLYEQALNEPSAFTPSLRRSAWATKSAARILLHRLVRRVPLLQTGRRHFRGCYVDRGE